MPNRLLLTENPKDLLVNSSPSFKSLWLNCCYRNNNVAETADQRRIARLVPPERKSVVNYLIHLFNYEEKSISEHWSSSPSRFYVLLFYSGWLEWVVMWYTVDFLPVPRNLPILLWPRSSPGCFHLQNHHSLDVFFSFFFLCAPFYVNSNNCCAWKSQEITSFQNTRRARLAPTAMLQSKSMKSHSAIWCEH